MCIYVCIYLSISISLSICIYTYTFIIIFTIIIVIISCTHVCPSVPLQVVHALMRAPLPLASQANILAQSVHRSIRSSPSEPIPTAPRRSHARGTSGEDRRGLSGRPPNSYIFLCIIIFLEFLYIYIYIYIIIYYYVSLYVTMIHIHICVYIYIYIYIYNILMSGSTFAQTPVARDSLASPS